MTREQAIDLLVNRPDKYARLLGFTKLGSLHREWIHDMVCGKNDDTLMAHRSSYKTTCVSIALAEIIILLPRLKTMFMRKTDTDIKEVIKQVQKILLDPHTQYIVQCIYGVNLRLTIQTANEISTNISTDVKGASQLIGIGTGGSLTGKHYDRIFTDDIINLQDRISKAERDRTKLIYQELQNIKNRDGRIFNTLTRWHKEDAYTLMPEGKKYTCYDTGLISKEELEEIRRSMSPSLFACNSLMILLYCVMVLLTLMPLTVEKTGQPLLVESVLEIRFTCTAKCGTVMWTHAWTGFWTKLIGLCALRCIARTTPIKVSCAKRSSRKCRICLCARTMRRKTNIKKSASICESGGAIFDGWKELTKNT